MGWQDLKTTSAYTFELLGQVTGCFYFEGTSRWCASQLFAVLPQANGKSCKIYSHTFIRSRMTTSLLLCDASQPHAAESREHLLAEWYRQAYSMGCCTIVTSGKYSWWARRKHTRFYSTYKQMVNSWHSNGISSVSGYSKSGDGSCRGESTRNFCNSTYICKCWKRYVDDVFCKLPRVTVSSLFQRLNELNHQFSLPQRMRVKKDVCLFWTFCCNDVMMALLLPVCTGRQPIPINILTFLPTTHLCIRWQWFEHSSAELILYHPLQLTFEKRVPMNSRCTKTQSLSCFIY